MSDVTTHLMEANLLAVFDQRDPKLRAEAIATTYSDDVQWTDDEGVVTGRDELNVKAAELQEKLQGLHFVKAGPSGRLAGSVFWPGKYAPRMMRQWYRASTWPRFRTGGSFGCGQC